MEPLGCLAKALQDPTGEPHGPVLMLVPLPCAPPPGSPRLALQVNQWNGHPGAARVNPMPRRQDPDSCPPFHCH